MVVEEGVKRTAYARVGLLGNPSDGYYGRTIAFAISNFCATVWLRPSEVLEILPHPHHDLCSFSSISHLADRVEKEGYYGGVRLLMAACKTFFNYASSHAIHLHSRNFTLSYDTNIPRQAGLSGSSALVCATMNCLIDFYDVESFISVEERPKIILSAESELGITAGLQDRVAQVYGGLVYMDFDEDHMRESGNGKYSPLDPKLLPPLYLIYSENPSDSGKIHSTVKKRWKEGDESVRSDMKAIAELAVKGKEVLLEGRLSEIGELMDENFNLRRRIFGDEALGEVNIKMIEVGRSVGAACKFTGSGGAAVAFCPKGSEQVELLREACSAVGFTVELAIVAPSTIHMQQ